jgi:hypothetical protein
VARHLVLAAKLILLAALACLWLLVGAHSTAAQANASRCANASLTVPKYKIAREFRPDVKPGLFLYVSVDPKDVTEEKLVTLVCALGVRYSREQTLIVWLFDDVHAAKNYNPQGEGNDRRTIRGYRGSYGYSRDPDKPFGQDLDWYPEPLGSKVHVDLGPPPGSVRIQVKQEDMCCFSMHFVAPEYPREARLKNIQGEAKLDMLIAPDNTVIDLHAVSGDPLLVAAAMKAASQWTFQMTFGGYSGVSSPPSLEIPLTFTFVIEDPPKPAWVHFTDGSAIRADEVHEYEDGFEYTADGKTHRVAPQRVTNIDGCRRVALIHATVEDGDCSGVIGGGPYFTIRAIPLLPAKDKEVPATH